MRGMLEEFRLVLETVRLRPPQIRIISTVGGTNAPVNSIQYWLDHIVQPVHFMQAAKEAMQSADSTLFVEIGADATLTRLGKAIAFEFDRNLKERQFLTAAELL
mmetsp:Transcript_101640/g.199377  ORF Transcript_101640/g.199377 Transcript_101640/m.199377 type:complete len:104 (-) Transcript_101640:69-380(-)